MSATMASVAIPMAFAIFHITSATLVAFTVTSTAPSIDIRVAIATPTVAIPVATFFQLTTPRIYIAVESANADADNIATAPTRASMVKLIPGTILINALKPTIISIVNAKSPISIPIVESNLSVGI